MSVMAGREAVKKYYRNLRSVLEKHPEREAELGILNTIGEENMGFLSLGSPDGRSFANFIKLLDEYGISYIGHSIQLEEDRSIILIMDRKDLMLAEQLRLEAYKEACSYRFCMERKEAEEKIASSDSVKDRNLFMIKGLNLFEKELLKRNCAHISPGFNIYEEEHSEYGSVTYDITVRESKAVDIEGTDFCRAYLGMMVSLYGYNGSKVINHIREDLNVEASIKLNSESDRVFYVVGANETGLKHYIEVSSGGFGSYISSYKNGRRTDTPMGPSYFGDRSDPEYEEKLAYILEEIPSKTIISTSKELDAHLRNSIRTAEHLKVTLDDKAIADTEREIVGIIDEYIKDRIREEMSKGIKNRGSEWFRRYMTEAVNVINEGMSHGSDDRDIFEPALLVKGLLESEGMDIKEYGDVIDALERHEFFAYEAGTHIMSYETEKDEDLAVSTY